MPLDKIDEERAGPGSLPYNDDGCAAVHRHGTAMVPWLDTGLGVVEVYAPNACFGNEASFLLFWVTILFSGYEVPKIANDAQ
jgi:hypothetical protein